MITREREAGRRIQLLTRHNDAYERLTPSVLYLHIRLPERNFHTIVLYLVIYYRGLIDVAVTDSTRLGLHNKEILQGLGTIHSEGKICKVVTELHRL